MPVNALSSTTLATVGGIDARQTRFTLTSTTGINGAGSLTSPQTALIIDNEKMLVQSVPISGTVEVIRGVDGTKARAHAYTAITGTAATVVWFGSKDKFGPGYETDYPALAGYGGTPENSLPAYGVPGTQQKLGGKVYVMCDFTATVHSGVVVSIAGDYTAAPLASGFQGSVGVVADSTATSDQWGWVQVYGAATAQDASATSGITSAYLPIVAGSVSSPNAGMTALANSTSTPQKWIYGMFITADATTVVTSAASHTGVGLPVFLNYPYTFAVATDIGMS